MPDRPLVSVLMTLYNKGPWVGEAVQSVLAQTLGDLELVVVDDASTDDGPAIVRSFNDPRIRLVGNEHNIGRAASAARGMAEARGGFVAVLDADDLMLPERLRLQVDLLQVRTDLAACGSQVTFLDDGSPAGFWPQDEDRCRGMALFADPMLYGATMFRRSVLVNAGVSFDHQWRRPGMDYLFMIELLTRCPQPVTNLPQVLTKYRRVAQNTRDGRDANADRRALYKEVFRRTGAEVSEDELDVQMMFHGHFPESIDRDTFQRMHHWKERLLSLAGQHPIFPDGPFQQEVERRWDGLFHKLADRSVGAGWAHLRSGGFDPRRLYYLFTRLVRTPATA